MSFVSSFDNKFRVTFEVFEKHKIGFDSIGDLHENIKKTLERVDQRNSTSRCKRIKQFNEMI